MFLTLLRQTITKDFNNLGCLSAVQFLKSVEPYFREPTGESDDQYLSTAKDSGYFQKELRCKPDYLFHGINSDRHVVISILSDLTPAVSGSPPDRVGENAIAQKSPCQPILLEFRKLRIFLQTLNLS